MKQHKKTTSNKSIEDMMHLKVNSETLRTSNHECEHREFKSAFSSKDIARYAKTMAAFANKDGGVIFFGVKSSPHELIGETQSPDDVTFSNHIKEHFEPEIRFSLQSRNYHGVRLLVVLVYPAIDKPVICRKEVAIMEHGKPNKVILRQGAIYYRYSSSTDEIKYAELRKILDEQVQRVFKSLVSSITLLNTVGYDKAAIVNAEELSGDNKTASVYITTETAKNLNWIDKGKFVENPEEGENAFYVVKHVQIKQGVEIPKPTDWSNSHPYTKTALRKEVNIKTYIDAALWKCGILNKPEYHMSSKHEGNMIHKFSEYAKEALLAVYPLSMSDVDKKNLLKQHQQEYLVRPFPSFD
jgi:hypothetical protein